MTSSVRHHGLRHHRLRHPAIIGVATALILLAASVVAFGVARPAAAGGGTGADFTAFVVTDSGQQLQAFDAENPSAPEQTIAVGSVAPAGATFEQVAIDPTAAEALVTVANPSGVVALSTDTGAPLGFVALPALGTPGPIAISPTGPAAVGDVAGATLALLAPAPNGAPTVTGTPSLPATEGGADQPFVCAVAYSPAGTLYAGATYQVPSAGPGPTSGSGASSCDLQAPVEPWLVTFASSGEAATPLVANPAPVPTTTSTSAPAGSPTSAGATAGSAATPGPVAALQVAPDGSTVYAALRSSAATSGQVVEVPAGGGDQPGTNILPASGAVADPTGLAMAPDGSTLYVAESAPSPQVVGLGTAGGVTGTAALPAAPAGVALTPDGTSLVATTGAGIVSVPIPFAGGGAGGGVAGGGASGGGAAAGGVAGATDPAALAITPDQAPVAKLAFRPASPSLGGTVTFSAARSTVRYGQISSYAWNFGDGSPTMTTTSPSATHAYAATGNFTVTVTETDSAGTSIPPAFATFPDDFTGQTALRRADASAQGSVSLGVVAPAPTTPPANAHPTTTTPAHPTPVKPHSTTTVPSKSTSRPTVVTRTPGTVPTTTTVAHPPGSPALTTNPGVGPPGEVVTFSGANFPPNTSVTVQWSPGVGSTVVTSSATGSVSGSILVLYGDQAGPRQLTAVGYPTAVANYLVVAADSGQFFFRR